MGNESTTTTQQSTEQNPWAPARPLLQSAIDLTQQHGTPEAFTPNFSDDTNQAIEQLSQLSQGVNNVQSTLPAHLQGSGAAYDQGLELLQQTAGGDFLEGNPYLQSVLDAGEQRISDRVNRAAAGAGRIGSGAHTDVLSRNLNEFTTQALFDNYNRERQNQLQAGGTLFNYGTTQPQLAGLLDEADIGQANLQLTAGQLQDQQANAEQLAGVQAAQFQAGIGSQIGSLGGTSNSSGTQTQSQSPNIPGMIAGGAGMLMGGPAFGGLGAGLQGFQQGFAGMHNPGFWSPTVSYG
ncbi:MAG: hypothetical protein AAGD43_03360 [Pseudomonadota bacterium]